MAAKSRCGEERVLRKIVPWLSRQLGDELGWLGRPEDVGYTSECVAARGVKRPLDAELGGQVLHVGVEHTTLEGFPGQRRVGGLLRQLRCCVRSMCGLVPSGNSVSVSVNLEELAPGCTERQISCALDDFRRRLESYLKQVPTDPSRDDAIRGYLLEGPIPWSLGALQMELRRFWFPGKRHLSLRPLLTQDQWENGGRTVLRQALESKLCGKADSFRAYRSEGWTVLLVLEVVDFSISSCDIVASFFRELAAMYDLASVDGIALVQEYDEQDATPECCWAYLRREVRSADQLYAELLACYGTEPNT